MTDRLRQKLGPLLTVSTAALPPIALFVLNNVSWPTSNFETIVLAYRVAIYVGLAIVLMAIYLAIRLIRAGGSYVAAAISLLIAIAFIVWVGPDAYLDLAALVSTAFGAS